MSRLRDVVGPEPPNAAAILETLPRGEINLTGTIKRRDEIVATLAAAIRKFMIAGQFEPHASQQVLMFLCHGNLALMREECWYRHVREHVFGCATQNKLTKPRVTVSSHHHQIGALFLRTRANLFSDGCITRPQDGNRRFDAVLGQGRDELRWMQNPSIGGIVE
jgi:hypothetical protein